MASTVLARIDRDVVVVSGPDATTFLQSLLSQDLDPVAVGESIARAAARAQGQARRRPARRARATTTSGGASAKRGFGPVLAQGLQRFKIRVKVEIEDRSADLAAVALRGADAIDIQAAGASTRRDRSRCAVDWRDAPGVELLGEPAAIDALVRRARAGAARSRSTPTRTRRCASRPACPVRATTSTRRTIAQEAFLERDAVSFTKGCFLGQELVCRIDSRGHVNRLLRRLRADAPLARGAVGRRRRQGGRHGHDRGRRRRAWRRSAARSSPAATVLVRRPRGDVDRRRRGRRRLESDRRARRDR